jgi:hypothetical protein
LVKLSKHSSKFESFSLLEIFCEQSSEILLKPSFDLIVQTKNQKLKELSEEFILDMLNHKSTHSNFLKWNSVFTFIAEHRMDDFLISKVIGKLYQNEKLIDILDRMKVEDDQLTFGSLVYMLSNSKDSLAKFYAKSTFLIMNRHSSDIIDKRENRNLSTFYLTQFIISAFVGISWISLRQISKFKTFNLPKIWKLYENSFSKGTLLESTMFTIFSSAFISANFYIFERSLDFIVSHSRLWKI